MSSLYKITVKRNEYRGFPIARLQISVGQEYHEGEKLKATVEWVKRHFEHSKINLCDSLQRHNLKFQKVTDPEASAVKLGDEWLKRNGQVIAQMPNLEVTRWNDWRNNPQYQNALTVTMRHYGADDCELMTIVDDMSQAFLDRRLDVAERQQEFLRASRLYILEETAVTQLMSEPDIAEIYPATFMKTIDYLKEKGLNAPSSMTTLGFKRRSSHAELKRA